MTEYRLPDVSLLETDLDNEAHRDAEQDFRDFYAEIREETQRKLRISSKIRGNFNFRKNQRTNRLSGMVDIYFDDKAHADIMFDALDGEVYNNYVLHCQWRNLRPRVT